MLEISTMPVNLPHEPLSSMYSAPSRHVQEACVALSESQTVTSSAQQKMISSRHVLAPYSGFPGASFLRLKSKPAWEGCWVIPTLPPKGGGEDRVEGRPSPAMSSSHRAQGTKLCKMGQDPHSTLEKIAPYFWLVFKLHRPT